MNSQPRLLSRTAFLFAVLVIVCAIGFILLNECTRTPPAPITPVPLTETPTLAPTFTDTPVPTDTPTPTFTLTETAAPTITQAATMTPTDTPTATPSPTLSPTPKVEAPMPTAGMETTIPYPLIHFALYLLLAGFILILHPQFDK